MSELKASRPLFKFLRECAGLFVFLLSSLFLLTSCASPDAVNLNYSLEDIQRAIHKTMPGGVRKTSENGRTFYGNYYDPYKYDHKTNGPKDKRRFRRYRAIVVVNGDRRPYSMEVRVEVEVRPKNSRMPASKKFDVNSGVFVPSDTSPATEDKLQRDIQKVLRDHDENNNVIDNFQPF